MPVDPLDALITDFMAALGDRLTINQTLKEGRSHIPKPQRGVVGDYKRYLNESFVVYARLEPEVMAVYDRIDTHGSAILEHTEDANIVGPVENLLKIATGERDDMRKLMSRIRSASTAPRGGWDLFATMLDVGLKGLPRQQQIDSATTDLTAYYIMQMPPADGE